MKSDFLLENSTAKSIYNSIKSLPVIDYHCHLSPKEIYDDVPFSNIGEVFLAYDHYKWRLMREAGIDEKFITGNSSWHDKFIAYIKALEYAAGNPLYHWTAMELQNYFDVSEPISCDNAELIWKKANDYIQKNSLSPRKLIKKSNVEFIATTDDMCDTLEYHKMLGDDESFDTKITPSFRTDKMLLIMDKSYPDYIKKLGEITSSPITNLESLMYSVKNRLDFFVSVGCKFSDVGIAYFPNCVSSFAQADSTFKKACNGEKITDSEYLGFLGFMYIFLGAEYKKRNIISQWHLCVLRNTNTKLFDTVGADCGVDCIGDSVSGKELADMLDNMSINNALGKMVVYTLNPSFTAQLVSILGAFPDCCCGAAWWFCDHKRGIKNTMQTIAEVGNIGTFLGMLTDSRSFLSYARHDYFRRILSNLIAEWVEKEDYPSDYAEKLAKKISYYNIKKLIEEL